MTDYRTPITKEIRRRIGTEIEHGLKELEEIERDLQTGSNVSIAVGSDEVLSPVAACIILGVSGSTLRRLIKSDLLQAETTLGMVCVDLGSVADYLFSYKYRAVRS